jgi:hypothetical protein
MYISTGASSNASGASYSLDGGHTWIDYADMSGTPMLGLGFTSGRIGWAGSYNTDVFTGGIFKHVPTGETHPAFSIDVTGGKGFTVNVTNVGDAAATDVQCTVTITGGFIVRPKQFSGSLPSLAIGENLTIHGTPKGIGLGLLFPLPSIQVDVSCTEDVAAAKTVQAQIFFSKVTLQ